MPLYKADLHTHTLLSPCGDLEMTPEHIIEVALRNGIDIIGITDHNSTRHCKLAEHYSKNRDIFVLCGAVISRPGLQFGLTVLAASLFSLLLESGQVLLPTRHSSQLDLLCNTAGAALAASIMMADCHWKKPRYFSLRNLA